MTQPPSPRSTPWPDSVPGLAALLDRLSTHVVVWDRELRNVYANAAARRFMRPEGGSTVGRTLRELFGDAVADAHASRLAAALEGAELQFDTTMASPDGPRTHSARLGPLRDDEGRIVGIVALVDDTTDHDLARHARQAIEASERKFRTLSDASPLGVFHTDAAGQCTYTNASWQAIYGMGFEDSLGEGWSRHVHPEDRTAVFAQWRHAAAAGRDFAMEFRVRRADGSVREVRSLARPVSSTDGGPTGYVGTIEDVTEARDAERRLRASERFLDRTGRLAGVGGWELDLVDRSIYWSDQTCRIHDLPPGYRPTLEEAIAFCRPEARTVIDEILARAIAEGRSFDVELPLVTATGRPIWVRSVGEIVFADGRPVRAFGAIQDVTGRRDTERALRASNRLLTQLYEQTPAMMHSLDAQGRILSVSDRWLEKMGYTRDEVIGRRSLEFFAEASREARAQHLHELWRAGHHTSGVLQVRRRDGRLMDIVASAIVQYDESGQPLRALVVSEDVTELLARTAELQREQMQRADVERYAAELDALLAERSEMLNVLAHEVRQPLNNASAALQSAAAALAEPSRRDDAAERLRRAEGVMRAVMSGVDNTLAAAVLLGQGGRTPPTQASDVDIDTLLAVAVGDMPLADRERVRVERVTGTRTASMDMGLLRLALRNLLANALRYSAPASPVVLRVWDSDEPLALVLDVIDQGPGIDAELLPRLFERGARGRNPSGRPSHGLGLYIVRRVLELHGGRAELVDTGPGGTTMRLWISQSGR